MQKPIKITVRRPELEPEEFVQKVRLGPTPEEQAEQEDSAEQLERHPPRRGRERRTKGPAPPVGVKNSIKAEKELVLKEGLVLLLGIVLRQRRISTMRGVEL